SGDGWALICGQGIYTEGNKGNKEEAGASSRDLHCDRRLYAGMGIITEELKIFEFELVDVFDGGIELELGQRAGLARELSFCLVEMIGIEVEVAEGVDEGAGPQIADLRHHHREQRIRGDVEGDAKE